MSDGRRGGGRGWKARGHNAEGRAHARERRRQEQARADLDRARHGEESEEDVEVPAGDRLRPAPGPQPLDGLLGEIVRARGWEQQLRIAQLHEAWPRIVGPELAGRSRPGRLEGPTLQVVVSSPGWATQLQYMTEQLVGRVVAETGIPIRGVRVVVGDVGDG